MPGHPGTTAPGDTTPAPLVFLFAPERPEPRGHLCHPNQFLPTGGNRLCCHSCLTLAPDRENTKAQSSFPIVKQAVSQELPLHTQGPLLMEQKGPGLPILLGCPVFHKPRVHKQLLVCMISLISHHAPAHRLHGLGASLNLCAGQIPAQLLKQTSPPGFFAGT